MGLRMRKTVVFAKVESTYGSDPTPDATNDALVVYDFEAGQSVDPLSREDKGVALGNQKELSGKARFNLAFTTELRGSGVAGTPPKGDDALFRACGLSVTNSPGASDTYAPLSASFESMAMYANIDGVQSKVLGNVGNLEIDLTAGEVGKLNWTFNGLWVVPTDVAVPTSYSPNTTVPPVCKNMTVQLDSYSPKVHSIKFNLNNVIAERPHLGATYGVAGFDITGRDIDGEMVIEALTIAEKNFWTSLAADTEMLLTVVVGSTAGNIITITVSRVRLRQINWGDQDGISTYTLPFQCVKSGNGNNEISIVFT